MSNKIKIRKMARHRNGISGEPFHVLLFSSKEISNGIAIIFKEASGLNPMVAILDLDKAATGDIAFGSNSWHGDEFSDQIRLTLETIQSSPLVMLTI